MSYTYGHEAAKKKNDMNTMHNLIKRGVTAKQAKLIAKKALGANTRIKSKSMNSLGRSTAAYIQSWQDRNRSNNGTKLNP